MMESMPMPDSKAQLRSSLKATLDAMSMNDRAAASSRLVDQILDSEAYRTAKAILAYASMPAEISVDALIDQGLGDGKMICVPTIDWVSKSMQPTRIQNLDTDLQTGRYGVRVPREGCPVVGHHEIDLILVPGRGFDLNGHRLGRGGGFYDRFIESLPPTNRPLLLGVCFGCQIVDRVPTEPHDHPMDRVVTERGFIEIERL